MPTVNTRAGQTCYDEAGVGPTVLLLAAGGHDRRDWDAIRPALATSFRTVALDWPGHGDSPLPAPGWASSAVGFAEVVEDVVDNLGLSPVAMMGNSVGGFAAGRLAIRRPNLVSALVLVDSGGFAANTVAAATFCSAMGRPGFLRRFYPRFAAQYMRADTPAARRVCAAAVATARRPGSTEVLSGLWRSFATPGHDLRADAGRISAPTLVVWGRRDPVIRARTGRRAAAMISGARFVALDTGHVPFVSRPAEFLAEVMPFLDQATAHTIGQAT
jgi:pimeloyl-ACP methyl ester carboxylesterase